MKKIILDTSFIISAVKQKIDFFNQIGNEGLQILIPDQTIRELNGLGAKTCLKILERNNFDTIVVKGKDADEAIVNFAKENPDTIVATLDAGLKKRIKNRKMIIRGRKKLEIV